MSEFKIVVKSGAQMDSRYGVRFFKDGAWGSWKHADEGELTVSVRDKRCLCDQGKRGVEGSVASEGWYFHSGQCCDCLNVRVYSNGATPSDWDSDPDYAEQNSDEIHICDLDAFIEMLQAARAAITGE